MKINLVQISRRVFSSVFLTIFFAVTFLPQNANPAYDYGVGRVRSCNPTSGAVEGLDFDPTMGGKDVEFVLSNPVCISVIAYAYASVKIAMANMNAVCGNSGGLRVVPSPILDAIDITKSVVKSVGNATCAGGVIRAGTSLSGALAVLGTIYLVAQDVYNDTRICGANWMGPNPTQYINSSGQYKAQLEAKIEDYIDTNQISQLNFDNKDYREWYFGGIEFEDYEPNGYCPDVTQPSVNGIFPPQKYYMRGLETGNFNCKKYWVNSEQTENMTQEKIRQYRQAYDCCKRRARDYVCIEYGSKHKFCKVGEKCSFCDSGDCMGSQHPVTFMAKSKDNGRLACAESYSLCPYNFSVGGGTDKCEFYQDGIQSGSGYTMITLEDVRTGNCAAKSEIRNDNCTYNNKAGRCKNYCQYMRHCTKTDLSDYIYQSSIVSPYFSNACLNFVGDSQNVISYGTGFVAGNVRHFSAPMAQCIKETMENVFYDRAGHTKCYASGETPGIGGSCPNGTAYKKGQIVSSESFFAKLQRLLQDAVKMTLTLSIVFYGTKLLFTGKDGVSKKELVMYIIKLGLVLYFATGDAWQTMFFDGVYGASTVFSQMVFKVQTADAENKRDGCQFGNLTLESGNQLFTTHPYPQGKEYLAIWDTLDCKIARYLGFGPEVSVANIALLILAAFFTGPPGIYFCIALLFFGLMMISATLRALHIFLSSAFSIILLIYISPIVICCSLFAKTNNIFKGWLTQLISFCLQPMILFAYIGIFISVMDKTFIGSATFYGTTPYKKVVCKEYCQNAYGTVISKAQSPNCDRTGEKIVRPKVDSVACMISYNAFGNWPGLELFGIGLPFLIDFFTSHTREKILTIVKAALVMYFLSGLMDEIPGIATALLGGAALPSAAPSASGMFKGIAGVARAIQKRGARGGMMGAKKAGRAAIDAAKEIAQTGNKGKSVDDGKESGQSSGGGGGGGGSSPKEGGGGGSSPKAGGGGSSPA